MTILLKFVAASAGKKTEICEYLAKLQRWILSRVLCLPIVIILKSEELPDILSIVFITSTRSI